MWVCWQSALVTLGCFHQAHWHGSTEVRFQACSSHAPGPAVGSSSSDLPDSWVPKPQLASVLNKQLPDLPSLRRERQLCSWVPSSGPTAGPLAQCVPTSLQPRCSLLGLGLLSALSRLCCWRGPGLCTCTSLYQEWVPCLLSLISKFIQT